MLIQLLIHVVVQLAGRDFDVKLVGFLLFFLINVKIPSIYIPAICSPTCENGGTCVSELKI